MDRRHVHVRNVSRDVDYPAPSELAPGAVDDLFAVMSSEECRHVVQYFRQASRSVADLDALVEHSLQLSDGDVDRTERAITLHHFALPRLDDAGLLAYDARQGTVRYCGCPAAEQLVARTTEPGGGRATAGEGRASAGEGRASAGDRREEVREHLEDAVRADEPATKKYHVREALQFLSIAGEGGHGETDDESASAE